MTRRRVLLGGLVAMAALVGGCASAQRPAARRAERAADWVPLRQGAGWSYDTQTGIGGDAVLATLSVVRAEGGGRFLVRSSNVRTETWEHRADGVVREGRYILRDPVREGTRWQGPTGESVIASVAPRREVAGQTYRDVVEVVHTARESGIVTRTWFAAGVGVVEIVAGATSSRGTTVQVHSTLRGYSLGDEAE
jgi:hypothetical protein